MLGGAALRKLRVIDKEHDEGIMRFIYNVMLPCFILDKMLGAEVLKNPQTLATGIAIGFFGILAGTCFGYIVGKIIGLTHGHGIRTFALASGTQNYGFTAVPVIQILWGAPAIAVLFVHNIGVELAIWSFGVMLISGERGMNWRRLINGPIIAVILGLILVSLRIDHLITGPARTAMSMMGIGAFPIAIFMTGASIIDLVGTERPSLKIAIGASLVRLLITPALLIAIAKFLPLSLELRQVLVVQAAMPAALAPILLARLYGGRPAVAVQVVIVTTVLSLFTLPWILAFGIRFLNLTPLTQ